MLRDYTFPVIATCSACLDPIKNIIRSTGLQIKSIDIKLHPETGHVTVWVEEDASGQDNEAIIRKALDDGGRLLEESWWQRWLNNNIPPVLRWILAGVGIISGGVMMAAMLLFAPLSPLLMIALGLISAAVSLSLGLPTIYRAFVNYKASKTLNMDTLYALGGLAAIIVTIAHLLLPGFPMLFDAALFIFGFKYLGDAVKKSMMFAAEGEINFTDRVDITVWVESSGEKIALDQVPIGSIIRIPRGAIIPINGIILDEDAYLYKTILNGKTTAKHYQKDKHVLSGYRVAEENTDEFIRIQTTHTVKESYLNQLDKRLAFEKQQVPQIINTSDNILRRFIPVVIGIALIAAIVMTLCFLPVVGLAAAAAIGVKCLIGVLVSACPCTLGLVIPLTVNAGLEKAEKNKVQFKDENQLQIAAIVNTLVFDLNGTLTTGKPIVKSFFAKKDHAKVLGYAQALETNSPHPFAGIIKDYCSKKQAADFKANDIVKHRTGLSGTIDGKHVMIGNVKMMQAANLDVKKYREDNAINISTIQQLTYITVDNEIVGHFVLEDPIRTGAKALIQKLKSMGYEIHLCTGADDETANAYAEELAIEHVFANCKNVTKDNIAGERSKTFYVDFLEKTGKIVAMIGDGGNDVLAMLKSHLGIAIKSDSSDAMTTSKAGVVIDDESLSAVVALFEVAQQTVSKIKQSLITSLALNGLTILTALVGTALTAFGIVFPPAIGAGLMVLVLIPVLINAGFLKTKALSNYEEVKAQDGKDRGTSVGLMRELEYAPGMSLPSPSPTTESSLDALCASRGSIYPTPLPDANPSTLRQTQDSGASRPQLNVKF